MGFNERNDAFDFNATLEDIKRERRLADLCDQNKSLQNSLLNGDTDACKDYSIKEGQKIHVSIPKRYHNIEEGWNSNNISPAEKHKKSSPKKSAFDVKSLVFGDKSSQAKKKSN